MMEGLTPEVIAEAQEIVDSLNRGLIVAEEAARVGEPTPDQINDLFRSAHSLKGVSGMFGLEQVTRLAHALETVLDGMRMGRVRVDAGALDVMFSCVEAFGVLIAAAEKGEEVAEVPLQTLVKQLETVAEGGPAQDDGESLRLAGLDAEVLSVLTEYEEHRLRENLRKGRGLFLLRTSFDLTDFDVGLAELDEAIKDLGEIITKLPSSEATEPGKISFDIIVGSEHSRDDLVSSIADDRIDVVPVQRRGLPERLGMSQPRVEVADELGAGPDAFLEEGQTVRSVSKTVRVDIRRLDRLMNLVGELALIRMTLQGITEQIRAQVGFTATSAELHKLNRSFERRLGELQAGIMEVRMVPLTNLFERMVRIGRKMGRELGREVRIDISGESTELDKLIVEDLADPLMHLIRNSIDHGIEAPEDRAAAGKPPEGRVRLTAEALGNHVVVRVEDDGRGVDFDKTKRRAVEQGLVSKDRTVEMTDKEICSLLFLPGFSTATTVTEYSGRGVGLDVVKNNISQLSGIIELESAPGAGTAITVTLPITLAIIPALIVNIAASTYAIPLNNVLETIEFDVSNMQTIERREVITVRGATVPAVDLRGVFSLEGERPDHLYGVIAGVGDTRMALLVDELVGQQDIVIKSLGRRLRARGIAGATELGNQRTILVIDTVDLLNELTGREVAAHFTGRNDGVA